ncbi:hypothetical protein Q1695_010542 [Nippostrongylus brasiliensis]|nr:hypothetical protein Q1695_010542 [Nippostrongylus brasiliensis]
MRSQKRKRGKASFIAAAPALGQRICPSTPHPDRQLYTAALLIIDFSRRSSPSSGSSDIDVPLRLVSSL